MYTNKRNVLLVLSAFSMLVTFQNCDLQQLDDSMGSANTSSKGDAGIQLNDNNGAESRENGGGIIPPTALPSFNITSLISIPAAAPHSNAGIVQGISGKAKILDSSGHAIMAELQRQTTTTDLNSGGQLDATSFISLHRAPFPGGTATGFNNRADFNVKPGSYVAIAFTTPSYAIAGVLDMVEAGAALQGYSLVTISEIAGDFRLDGNQGLSKHCTAKGLYSKLAWTVVDGRPLPYNLPESNEIIPQCHLHKNKTYYINLTFGDKVNVAVNSDLPHVFPREGAADEVGIAMLHDIGLSQYSEGPGTAMTGFPSGTVYVGVKNGNSTQMTVNRLPAPNSDYCSAEIDVKLYSHSWVLLQVWIQNERQKYRHVTIPWTGSWTGTILVEPGITKVRGFVIGPHDQLKDPTASTAERELTINCQ